MDINLEAIHTADDFLSLLIILGEKAKALRDTQNTTVNWSSIGRLFADNAYPPPSIGSKIDHTRWMDHLRNWSEAHKIESPGFITRQIAAQLANDLASSGIAAERRFRFFRRVWRTIGLDETIWNVTSSKSPPAHEHYRRLTRSEVRRLVRVATLKDNDLADMIIIGYSTGLRLSDVFELEKSEVLLQRHALRIVPNKVRLKKPQPLLIPLTEEADEIISARVKRASTNYLFPDKCRSHASRKIESIFKSAKIRKIGNGRASFHSLRATFISLMDEAGIQPYITDAITGHASGSMHARYTQPSLPVLRRAIRRAIPRVRTRCP